MQHEIENICDLLKRTFEKNAWHGPAVKEVLEDITVEQSTLKFHGTHSIGELVAHMTAWRTFVTRKLQGDNDYKVTDEMNFPTLTNWAMAKAALDASQGKLLEAIAIFDPARLHEKVSHTNYNYSFYTLLHGIIHHDLYHVGQIAIIKKQTI